MKVLFGSVNVYYVMGFRPNYFNCIRAPTVDVGYVPNAKYLAHIPHQTQKIAP